MTESRLVYDHFMEDPCSPLGHGDILPPERFLELKPSLRKLALRVRNLSRVFLGENCSFVFENKFLWWYQIQEMLRIEGHSQERIREELEVYNPFIPKPCTLSGTLMIEVPNSEERKTLLERLPCLEDKVFLKTETLARPIQSQPLQGVGGEKSPTAITFLKFPMEKSSWDSLWTRYQPIFIEIPAFDKKEVMLPPSLWAFLKALYQEKDWKGALGVMPSA